MIIFRADINGTADDGRRPLDRFACVKGPQHLALRQRGIGTDRAGAGHIAADHAPLSGGGIGGNRSN